MLIYIRIRGANLVIEKGRRCVMPYFLAYHRHLPHSPKISYTLYTRNTGRTDFAAYLAKLEVKAAAIPREQTAL